MIPEQITAEIAELRVQVTELKAAVEKLGEQQARSLAVFVVTGAQFTLLIQLLQQHTDAKYKEVDLENHVRKILLHLGDRLPLPAEAIEKVLIEMKLLTPENPAP